MKHALNHPSLPFHHSTRWMVVGAWAALAMSLTGCGIRIGGNATISAENDRLRDENADLKETVEDLQLRDAEFRRKVEAIPAGPSADAVAALPVLTTFEIASTAHTRPARDGRASAAVVHLTCRDGRDRAIQITGSLRIVVSVDGAPVAERTLNPLELREAFRSGLGGGGYTVEVPLPTDRTAHAVVEAEFTDGFGRGLYTARREITELDRPQPVRTDEAIK